jgi:hypothetical protein
MLYSCQHFVICLAVFLIAVPKVIVIYNTRSRVIIVYNTRSALFNKIANSIATQWQ